MKILHVNPYPPNHLGGSELFTRNLAINLAKKEDISCDILTSDIFNRKIDSEMLNPSVRVFYKKCYYNLWGKNPLVNMFNFLLKNYKNYDLIHAHSYIFFSTFQCAILKKISDFPFILHVHGGIDTPIFKNLNFVEQLQLSFKNSLFDKGLGEFTFKQANALISVSKKDLYLIKNKFDLPQSQKSYYIPNGIDINKYRKYNSKYERIYITYIGRLSYVKGLDIFIKTIKVLYKKNKDLRFLIIGDGPLRFLVDQARRELPIKYFNTYPYDKMQDIYNMSKVLVLTSRFEGMPTTILESLACETPVIATDVGGVSEVMKDNETGYLFDLRHFKEGIDKILDLNYDQEKIRTLGKNGRDLIKNNFSWTIITDKIERVYRNINK